MALNGKFLYKTLKHLDIPSRRGMREEARVGEFFVDFFLWLDFFEAVTTSFTIPNFVDTRRLTFRFC